MAMVSKNMIQTFHQQVGLYILEVIREGYRLPLKESPPRVLLKNNKSARESMNFVQEEIESLIKKGVVSQVQEIPKVIIR